MIRKGNKYIMVVRTLEDLKEIRNNIDKYKDELKDGELIEVQLAKSGKYMLKMMLSKDGIKYEISGEDKKHMLTIENKDDAVALQKLIQILLAIAFNNSN
jgi:hypothetical protein